MHAQPTSAVRRARYLTVLNQVSVLFPSVPGTSLATCPAEAIDPWSQVLPPSELLAGYQPRVADDTAASLGARLHNNLFSVNNSKPKRLDSLPVLVFVAMSGTLHYCE